MFKTYLPAEYPYDVVGAQRTVKLTDFDDKIDIIPVADPNIFSQSQRISLAQTELQLAMSNPQMHNLYEAYRDMYEAIGVKNIDLSITTTTTTNANGPCCRKYYGNDRKTVSSIQRSRSSEHTLQLT